MCFGPKTDHRVSVVVAAASLKEKQKTIQNKNAASFVDVQGIFVPKIMCLFMETDFMYLPYERLESGDTYGLFEEWICVWFCGEEGRCSRPCGSGGRVAGKASFPRGGGHVATSTGSGWEKLPQMAPRGKKGQPKPILGTRLTRGPSGVRFLE